MRADTPLRYLKGVGPGRAAKLERLGLAVLEDLLYVMPFRYEDRRAFALTSELKVGSREATLHVRVDSTRLIRTRRAGLTIFEAIVSDDVGSVRTIWYNQPYLVRVFVPGRHAVLFGRPSLGRNGIELVLENPDYEILEDEDAPGVHTGRIVPVYRKLGEVSSRLQRTLIYRGLSTVDPASLTPLVPANVFGRHGLLERFEALRLAHFPSADASLEELGDRRTPAQRTLAFEEIFLLQLALAVKRRGLREEKRGIAYEVPDAMRTRLARLLPFKLTRAQHRVLKEIGEDLRSPHPMNRLLQGDVGSGKTIVALLALLVAVENGYQGALMAPTEILAEQHERTIGKLFELKGAEYRMVLLTGAMRSAARRKAVEAIASGAAQIAVGTHALFESEVVFKRLGLVVIDEQHRFGVRQRAALSGKGARPDVLVMTATPIPRSLALTLYGDLDLSTIDELPPGRTPVTTVVRAEGDREKVYAGLRGAVSLGRQAYVVVPLIEETEKGDLKAATAFAAHLSEKVLPHLRVGLLHGRMKASERESVMQEFIAGKTQVLVATTVIEVGVDVPNAAVMIVEHAERFGLSQLHQLRGRVGRGAAKSYCVLMVGDGEPGREARERLQIMAETTDGFRIAEKDLEIRGPGAVFGTQQHGLTDLQFLAVILRDGALLETARSEAQSLLAEDPSGRDHVAHILASVRPGWKKRLDLASVG